MYFQQGYQRLFIILTTIALMQSCGGGGSGGGNTDASSSIVYLKGHNTNMEDTFGGSVALSADGNTLVIAADLEDSDSTGINGNGTQPTDPNLNDRNYGAVYVFIFEDGNWTQQAYIKPDYLSGDSFGNSIALSSDGDTLAIGQDGNDSDAISIDGNEDNNLAPASGAVFIYVRTMGIWRKQAFIKASNAESNDMFGGTVSLSGDGDTLAVGAQGEDSGDISMPNSVTALESGAVYTFTRTAGVWKKQSYIKASNIDAFDSFGSSLALSSDGNTMVVGAVSESSNSKGIDGNAGNNAFNNSGAAYLFRRDSSSWVQEAYIKASNTDMNDAFGYSVSLSSDGNRLVVGASSESGNSTGMNGDQADNSFNFAGAVYDYIYDGKIWKQINYIKASNTENDDQFGGRVLLSPDGNNLLVSASNEAGGSIGINGNQFDNSNIWSGAVYFFKYDGLNWSQDQYIKASNTGVEDFFGESIAISGDAKTIAIGAITEDGASKGVNGDISSNGAANAGAVYIY